MTDVSITFRLDPALKAAFVAMAGERDLSVALLLRRMVRDAVARHVESTAHDGWRQREVDDAILEAEAMRGLSLPNETVEQEWRLRKAEFGHGNR